MKRVTVRLATRWGCELRAKNEKRKKGLIFKSKDEYLGQNKMERQTPLTHPPPPPKKSRPILISGNNASLGQKVIARNVSF